MPRGGRRAGNPGTAYANRTDLNGSTPLPATAATGQPYGAAGAQLAAQKIVPMQGTPVPPVAPQAPEQSAPVEPTGPMPGELPALTAPTTRPHEPLTHGLPVGAGAGPEVLPPTNGPSVQYQNVKDMLTSLATVHSNSPALATLAAYASSSL